MLVQNAFDIIRARTNDTGALIFTDTELMHYVNMGITVVANMMIKEGNPFTVKSVSVSSTTGLDIPDDFHSLMPGETAYIGNGKINLDGAISGSKDVRYFSSPALVDAVGDTIPFPSAYVTSVINAAVEFAIMRIGKDVSQEREGHVGTGNMTAARQTPLGASVSGGGNNAGQG